MKESKQTKCFFCGSEEIRLPAVSIALCMRGDHYSFCADCLNNMSADEFWKRFFGLMDYAYPPKTIRPLEEYEEVVDDSEMEFSKNHSRKTREQKEREKLTKGLRYDIMRRDKFRCVLCGATAEDCKLVIDHIKPIAKGGKTEENNLRTLCASCNSGKSTKIE